MTPKHWIRWLFGVAALAAVIMVARHFSEAKDFAVLAERAEPGWFVVAVILQAGTYVSQGQVYRSVATAGGFLLGLGTAYRLSLAKLFVDQAIPSGGLSGTVVLATGLQRRGMPRSVIAAAIVVDIVVWAPEFFAFPSWAAGADLMFAEASSWSRPIRFARGAGGHLPVLEVAEAARASGVRRLVFAHIGRPTLTALAGGARPPFGELAHDGQVFTLPGNARERRRGSVPVRSRSSAGTARRQRRR